MAKPTRWVTIDQLIHLSPHLTRVILVGDDLNDFPAGQESGYIKWCFSPALRQAPFTPALAQSLGDALTPTPDELKKSDQKPVVRSMTIRAFSPASANAPAQLTVDIARHGDLGPASYWINHAAIGQGISIIGPGDTKLTPVDPNYHLFVGDLTALAAIKVNLEHLPSDAEGDALIAIPDANDQRPLTKPDGVRVHWLIDSEVTQIADTLLSKVQSLPLPSGSFSAWIAGEFDTMRQLRRYLKSERRFERGALYASSYWKIGTNDEGNKQAKKLDPEA